MDPSIYVYYERLNQNPDDAEALWFLWEYHGARAEFQQLATLVEQTATRRSDPRSAADLFYRAGELWAKNVGRVDKAVGNYKRAFDLDNSQLAAVEAARAIYLQLGNARSAAQLLDRQLGVTRDPTVRLLLLKDAAAIRGQLGDLNGQVDALRELAGSSPDDWEALRELAAAYLARAGSPQAQGDDAMNAAHVLATLAQSVGAEHGLAFAEAALDAFPGEETAYAIVHHGYLNAGRADDLAVRQIGFLTANPESPLASEVRRDLGGRYLDAGQIEDAIVCLQPLASQDLEIARTLVGLYRETGKSAELAAMLQALPPAEDPAQRIQDLHDLAEIHGQQGNRAAMLQAMRDALALDPSDAEALALIEDDLRARGAYGELREVLYGAVRAASGGNPEDNLPRLREIAQLSEQRLEDTEAAVEAWRALLEWDASDPEALGALERLYTRAERWDELAAVLEHRARAAEGEARKPILERLAKVHRDRRNDPAAEADALAELLAFAPDDGMAARLIEVRRAAGDNEGAAEVMRDRAERADDDRAPELWTELATHLAALGDVDRAVVAWQEVVRRDPARGSAWDSLEQLLERNGRHAQLFETLVAHAEAVPEGDLRASLHARAAEAAHAAGEDATALEHAERAVALAPRIDRFAAVLMDLLEATGQREKLLAFVTERGATLRDGTARIDLYRRAAHAVGQTDPKGATEIWEELRACARRAQKGDDAEALDALMGFAEVADDQERLVGLLKDAAAFAPDLELKREFLRRRAELQTEALGRPDDALGTLESLVREVDPGYALGWGMLADLAGRHARFDLAAEALARQVALVTDDELKASIAGRLVALVEKELKDPGKVIEALEVQHAADPNDFGVVQRLADLCEAHGRFADAVKYLEELAEIEGDDEELSTLTQRIAQLAEDKLGEGRKAFDVLLPLAKVGDIAALDMLRGVAARQKLEGELAPTLTDLASRAGRAEDRAGLWREVAELSERVLGDHAKALEAYVRALTAAPALAELLDPIDRLATEARDAAQLGAAYRAALGGCVDPTTAHELAMRGLATLEIVGAPEKALDLALSALGRAPADDDIVDAVVRLAADLGRKDDVYLAFDKRRRAAQTDAERHAVVLRAAGAAAAALGDRETAFQYLDQAMGQAIGRKEPDEEMLLQVEAAAREADQKRPEMGMLSGVVERFAQLAEDAAEDQPRVASVLLRRAGALCDSDLGLVDHTVALFSRAVSVWPDDLRPAEQLEEAATRYKRLPEVVALYQRVIDEAYEPATVRRYMARRAAILGDRLKRVDEAIEALGRLVENNPKDPEPLRTLQEMLERHGRWQSLLVALERELELGVDKVPVYKRIAGVWEHRLRNAFEAKNAWRKVLSLDPNDDEALAAKTRLERKAALDDDDLEEATPGSGTAAPPPSTELQASPDLPDGPPSRPPGDEEVRADEQATDHGAEPEAPSEPEALAPSPAPQLPPLLQPLPRPSPMSPGPLPPTLDPPRPAEARAVGRDLFAPLPTTPRTPSTVPPRPPPAEPSAPFPGALSASEPEPFQGLPYDSPDEVAEPEDLPRDSIPEPDITGRFRPIPQDEPRYAQPDSTPSQDDPSDALSALSALDAAHSWHQPAVETPHPHTHTHSYEDEETLDAEEVDEFEAVSEDEGPPSLDSLAALAVVPTGQPPRGSLATPPPPPPPPLPPSRMSGPPPLPGGSGPPPLPPWKK